MTSKYWPTTALSCVIVTCTLVPNGGVMADENHSSHHADPATKTTAINTTANTKTNTATTALDDVIVKGERGPEQDITQHAHPVSTTQKIDAATLERNLSTDLSDALRYEPGVTVSGNNRGSIGSINIRGLDGDRVKLMVDGLEMPDSYTPQSASYLNSGRASLDLDSVGEIQIIKGGDISAGSGAMSGVVQFRSKRPDDYLPPQGDESYASLKGSYRSDANQFSQTATLANRSGRLESMLLYTHRSGDEQENYYGDGDGEVLGPNRRAVDPGEDTTHNWLGKLIWHHNNQNQWGLTAEHFNTEADYDLYSETTADRPQQQDDEIKRQRLSLFHLNTQRNVMYDRLRWQLDYQQAETNSFTDNPSTQNRYNRSYEQKDYQLKADLTKQLGDHQLSYGGQYIHRTYENLSRQTSEGVTTTSRFSPKAQGDYYGLYLQDHWQVTHSLSLLPAIRYDHYKIDPETDQHITSRWDSNEDDRVTAQLGLNWIINDITSAYARYGTGFRAPTLENSFYYYENAGSFGGFNFGYLIRPNPDLKPEKSTFAEAALRFEGRLGSAELAIYDNHYKDFIQKQFSLGATAQYPTGTFTTVNLNKVNIHGVELKGELDLAEALNQSNLSGLTLSGALAYAKDEYDDYEDGEGRRTRHVPLDSIAPMQASMALAYEADHWGSALHVAWTDAKDSNDISDINDNGLNDVLARPSYTLVDLTGYVDVMDHLRLSAGVYNLLDKRYWQWDDVRGLTANQNLDRYTQSGRNYGISARYTF